MVHEQTTLSSLKGFGGISHCTCGLYHVRLPGISVHLRKDAFDHLVQLILEAKENQDLCPGEQKGSKKSYLKVVKT
jgi:hypothetical protein